MGFMDKLLGSIRYDDDDYEDDEYYDDDEVDEAPRRSSRAIKTADMDDDYEEKKPSRSYNGPRKGSSRTMSNGMEVVVIKPTSVDEAREITQTLLENRTVVLNMEGLDMDIAQRIIDFTSGSTYAIDGTLQKISNMIFIVTPKSVGVSGDFQEILAGSFDVPSIRSKF
ncbi:MAG: cell division protein SepF [Lachnospiraceae bacterium]|nr:cell division protein SepF [Lachnospiraceae bacterium]